MLHAGSVANGPRACVIRALAAVVISVILVHPQAWAQTSAVATPPAPEAKPALDATPAERPVDRAKEGRDRAPIIRLPLAQTPPAIDGDLGDACWKQAYHSTEFWNCDANRRPDQQSEVWLCVDAQALYVAVYCHDTKPALIHAEETKRNGNYWQDDLVRVTIDPTYTQTGGTFSFYLTARGTMAENIPGGSDAKVEWRGDWRAAGRTVTDGWIGEAAIPWEILRYPRGQSQIGLAVCRHIPRTDEWTWWPDMGAGYDDKKMAHIVGLRLPRISRPVLWMPNVQVEVDSQRRKSTIGLDVSHTFENGLTGIATWAPDFRNIEEEVASIDFSYNERYYDDMRPFFITGGGYMPNSELLYTRRIPDLDLGTKLFGSVGGTDIGLLQSLTFGQRSDTAVKVRRQINDEWSADWQYALYDPNGGSLNTAWRLGTSRYEPKGVGGLWIGGSLATSDTRDLNSGHHANLDIERWRGDGRWGYSVGYDAVSPDYDPQDGYEPEVDRRGPSLSFSYSDKPPKGKLKSCGVGLYGDRYQHYDGSLFHTGYGFYGYLSRKQREDGVNLNVSWTDRPPNHDHLVSIGYSWGQDQLHRNGYINCSVGHIASANYTDYTGGWSWAMGKALFGNLSYEQRHSDYWDPSVLDEDIKRTILSMNYDFSAERGLGLGLRTGTLGTNLFITYHQAARAGRDWFVILGDPNADDTQKRFAVKTKWIWK